MTPACFMFNSSWHIVSLNSYLVICHNIHLVWTVSCFNLLWEPTGLEHKFQVLFFFLMTATKENYCRLARKKFVWNLLFNDKQTIIYVWWCVQCGTLLASTFLLGSCSANAKIAPVHTMKTRASIAPLILNLGTIRGWVISFMPLLLIPGEITSTTH
jgi:hypothetical protein